MSFDAERIMGRCVRNHGVNETRKHSGVKF